MRAAFLGRGAGEHDASLAFAPAAIIERERDVAVLREDGAEASAGVFLRAAGASAEHDRGQPVVRLAIRRQIQMRRHAGAVAPDTDGALLHIVGLRLRIRGA